MFECASSNFGYSASSTDITIQYNGDNLDCHVLFKSMDHVRRFRSDLRSLCQNCLIEKVYIYDIRQVDYGIEPNLLIIEVASYKPEDSSSNNPGAMSVTSTAYETVATLTSKPLCALQMIENSEFGFISHVDLVRCHLISKQKCDANADLNEYNDDENNFLFMSWAMHQRFDGLYSGIPTIAIRYGELLEKHEGSIADHPFSRTKVSVVIEFRKGDKQTAADIKPILKEHLYDSAKNEFTLCVSVVDPDKFKICLDIKYLDNTTVWSGGPNFNDQKAERRKQKKIAY